MRFSILTLDLGFLSEEAGDIWTGHVSRFIAEHNISCVCMQGCGQHSSSPPVPGRDSLRQDNVARSVERHLGRLGLKYGLVWDWSHLGSGDCEMGHGVLSQLPILGNAAAFVTEAQSPDDPLCRKVVAARLGISPEVHIDVLGADMNGGDCPSAAHAERLITFIRESASILTPTPTPPPRRRGRPPRQVAADSRPSPVRMVFLAGKFGKHGKNAMTGSLAEAGFVDCSASVSTAPVENALFIGSRDDRITGAGERKDSIFLRPALRPTDGMSVFAGEGSTSGFCPVGTLLGFEV